jgi:hypothetical protein
VWCSVLVLLEGDCEGYIDVKTMGGSLIFDSVLYRYEVV